MKRASLAVGLVIVASVGFLMADDKKNQDGAVPLFDGRSLEGWDGDPDLWRVEDGAIVGQTTNELKPKGGANTFLIYTGNQELADFELRIMWKLEGGNSGVQYRSKKFPDAKDNHWVVGGYQADMDGGNTYTGICYEERGRGILVPRGQTLTIDEDGKKAVEKKADEKEIVSMIKKGDWNEYVITCKGNHCVQKINGATTAEFTDNQPGKAAAKGILALQIHQGPPMKVSFKDIQLKKLDGGEK
jgi:hypothetical protein